MLCFFPLISVVGNEGKGVRASVASQCDFHVYIPRSHSQHSGFSNRELYGGSHAGLQLFAEQGGAEGEEEAAEENNVGEGRVAVVDSLNVSNAVAIAVYEASRALQLSPN